MVENHQDVLGYAGDTINIYFNILDSGGSPLDVTEYSFQWELRRIPADITPVLVKTLASGITVITPSIGYIRVTISKTESALLSGQYVQLLIGTDETTEVQTLSEGNIVISEKYSAEKYVSTYTTPEMVASLLRLSDGQGHRIAFDETTDPARSEVAMMIRWAEDSIDKYTNNSWKVKTVSDALYSLPFPYHGVTMRWLRIPVRHRNIIALQHLYISNSNGEEVDYVTSKAQGQGGDWYVDKLKGIIYVRYWYPFAWRQNAVRVSYTYGEGVTAIPPVAPATEYSYTYDIPGDVQEICTKMVAIKLMENDFSRAMINDGMKMDVSRAMVIDRWRADIEMGLKRRMNYAVLTGVG